MTLRTADEHPLRMCEMKGTKAAPLGNFHQKADKKKATAQSHHETKRRCEYCAGCDASRAPCTWLTRDNKRDWSPGLLPWSGLKIAAIATEAPEMKPVSKPSVLAPFHAWSLAGLQII